MSDKPETPNQGTPKWLDVLTKFIPSAGIFTGLLYFLGRLHLEAYYSALGINSRSLSFTTNDYMFSSFELLIMLVTVSVCLYIAYKMIISNKNQPPKKYLLFMIIVGLILWVLVFKGPVLYIPGFSAFEAGLALGITCLAYSLYYFSAQGFPSLKKAENAEHSKEEKPGKKLAVMVFGILIGLGIIASLPLITNAWASKEAKTNVKSFPYVTIMAKNNLPEQLQYSSSNLNESIKVQLVTIDNGTIYLLKTTNENEDHWSIITLSNSEVRDIIYYDPGSQKSE